MEVTSPWPPSVTRTSENLGFALIKARIQVSSTSAPNGPGLFQTSHYKNFRPPSCLKSAAPLRGLQRLQHGQLPAELVEHELRRSGRRLSTPGRPPPPPGF